MQNHLFCEWYWYVAKIMYKGLQKKLIFTITLNVFYYRVSQKKVSVFDLLYIPLKLARSFNEIDSERPNLNFDAWLEDIWAILNEILQFHFEEAILKMLKITLNRSIKLTFNLMLFLSTQCTINNIYTFDDLFIWKSVSLNTYTTSCSVNHARKNALYHLCIYKPTLAR
jgi:hypothetical protein